MTLEDAIKHAKEVALYHKRQATYNFQTLEPYYQKCEQCAEEHEQLAIWLAELKRYKELKENGRLIELPCAVGDTLWIIAPNYYKCNNRYNCEDYNPEEYLISWCQKNCSKGYQEIGTIQCVIYGIETYNDENSVQIDCLLDVNGNHYRYSIKDIFLTKEEAEEKLKELRGEQE